MGCRQGHHNSREPITVGPIDPLVVIMSHIRITLYIKIQCIENQSVSMERAPKNYDIYRF